jgi:hypothetical protein
VTVAPCSQTGVLRLRISGVLAPSPTASCSPDTNVSTTSTGALSGRTVVKLASEDNRGVYITDPYGALVRLAVTAGEPGSVAALPNSQVAFQPSGLPSCTADLQNGRISCSGLVPGARYTLTRGRGRSVLRGRADDNGIVHTHGFAGPQGLRGGDVVSLRNRFGRVLTTLHVAHLQVDIIGAQKVIASGICEAGDYYGPALNKPPTSAGVVELGVAGTGDVCPQFADPTGLPTSHIEQVDDLSGGMTVTRVPSLAATSPVNDATVYGPFTALADVTLPGSSGAVNGANARVELTVVRIGGRVAVFRSANVNTPSGVAVPALVPGVYRATWKVVDQNGDTRTVTTRFIESP